MSIVFIPITQIIVAGKWYSLLGSILFLVLFVLYVIVHCRLSGSECMDLSRALVHHQAHIYLFIYHFIIIIGSIGPFLLSSFLSLPILFVIRFFVCLCAFSCVGIFSLRFFPFHNPASNSFCSVCYLCVALLCYFQYENLFISRSSSVLIKWLLSSVFIVPIIALLLSKIGKSRDPSFRMFPSLCLQNFQVQEPREYSHVMQNSSICELNNLAPFYSYLNHNCWLMLMLAITQIHRPHLVRAIILEVEKRLDKESFLLQFECNHIISTLENRLDPIDSFTWYSDAVFWLKLVEKACIDTTARVLSSQLTHNIECSFKLTCNMISIAYNLVQYSTPNSLLRPRVARLFARFVLDFGPFLPNLTVDKSVLDGLLKYSEDFEDLPLNNLNFDVSDENTIIVVDSENYTPRFDLLLQKMEFNWNNIASYQSNAFLSFANYDYFIPIQSHYVDSTLFLRFIPDLAYILYRNQEILHFSDKVSSLLYVQDEKELAKTVESSIPRVSVEIIDDFEVVSFIQLENNVPFVYPKMPYVFGLFSFSSSQKMYSYFRGFTITQCISLSFFLLIFEFELSFLDISWHYLLVIIVTLNIASSFVFIFLPIQSSPFKKDISRIKYRWLDYCRIYYHYFEDDWDDISSNLAEEYFDELSITLYNEDSRPSSLSLRYLAITFSTIFALFLFSFSSSYSGHQGKYDLERSFYLIISRMYDNFSVFNSIAHTFRDASLYNEVVNLIVWIKSRVFISSCAIAFNLFILFNTKLLPVVPFK